MKYIITNTHGLYFTGTAWSTLRSDAQVRAWDSDSPSFLAWLRREAKQNVYAQRFQA